MHIDDEKEIFYKFYRGNVLIKSVELDKDFRKDRLAANKFEGIFDN